MAKPRADRLFRAFADETRLRILHLLTQGELCVCDLMSVLKEPQSKVSRHLSYLREERLVSHRKEGLWRHYSLAKPVSRAQKALLGCLRDRFGEFDALRRDRRGLERLERGRDRC